MEGFLPALLRMSLTGALTVLAVLLGRLCLRRAPRKYVCFLWLAVLFRLLCPVTLRAPTSVVPEKLESGAAVERWTSAYAEETKTIWENMEGFEEAVAAGRSVGHSSPLSSIRPDADYVVTAADGLSEPKRVGEVWLPILGWVWLAGAAALLLWSVFKYLRLRFRLREAARLEKGVYEAEGLDSPFVLGFLRPRVYLPWGMDKEERKWVLLHERAHVRRLDPLWKLLGWLALCLHWFNPLCWLAFSLAMQDMEGACDEAVVRTLDGEERAAYSRLLLALSAGRPLFAATPLGFGEGNVKQRIKSVLRWRKPKWWMVLLTVLLLAAVVLLFAFGPQRRAESAPEPTPAPSPLPRYPVEEGWTLLGDEELEAWKAVTAAYPYGYPDNGAGTLDYNQLANNPMSACFTSFYQDPTELDLNAFLRYYYYEESATEAEFRALRDAGKLSAGRWWHIEDLPTPLHRIPASQVEGDLQHFYGIGLRDLKKDYRLCSKYLPEYDCFYTTTSDWGPGVFQPEWGEKKEDLVRLWQSQTSLTCRKLEEGWVILSFWNENAAPGSWGSDEETRPSAQRTYYGSPEYRWVFTPVETEYYYEDGGETVTGTIPAGWRLKLEGERFTPEGEIWLRVEEEAVKAPGSRQVWISAEDALPWTEELAAQTVWPVYIPAGTVYYPRTFGYGEQAKASLEDCLNEDNASAHGYDLSGAILSLEDGYALVGFAGGMEVWVKQADLTVGKPEEERPYDQTRMLAAGREKAKELGYPLETWGAEMIWHRGKSEDGSSAYYAAYYPVSTGVGTVCVVFTGSYETGYTPAEAILIPPGAEDWP